MIEILFKDCCDSCPHIDVGYETYGVGITSPTTMIGCKHMSVCGQYHREEWKEPPGATVIRGSWNADG